MAGVASANISTGNVAIKTEQQDGKTEPASQATDWDFIAGKGSLGFSQRKRMNYSASNLSSDALLPELLPGELSAARLQH